MNDQLLTTPEVAALFGVHAKTVRKWIKQGRLRGVRTPGGGYRVRASDVQTAYAEMQRVA